MASTNSTTATTTTAFHTTGGTTGHTETLENQFTSLLDMDADLTRSGFGRGRPARAQRTLQRLPVSTSNQPTLHRTSVFRTGSGLSSSDDTSTRKPVAALNPEAQDFYPQRSPIQVLSSELGVANVNLKTKQRDPKSPLHSASSFEDFNLKPELVKGLYQMGFNSPSRIQEATLKILWNDPPENVIAQSQSGTGKTAAFVLAMLSRVDVAQKYPQVLCLAPTCELALQIGNVAKTMGQFCPEIKSAYAVKGPNGKEVKYGVQLTEHIIIGTAGKVTEWIFGQNVFDITRIKVFILDETDAMLSSQGYNDKSIKIHRELSPSCQIMLFSSTFGPDVTAFMKKILPTASIFRLRREEEILDNIKQYYINCQTNEDKYKAIASIYASATVGQAIIFCKTQTAALWLAKELTRDGHAVACLSGKLTIEQRSEILNRFRDSVEKVLITTNILSRGIDVEKVTLVVNYDVPLTLSQEPDYDTYLHRIGRTGRFGKPGLAINLVDSKRSLKSLLEIGKYFSKTIALLDPSNIVELEKLDK